MLQCALNIARWWLVEYNKQVQGNNQVRFPGEVTMLCGLMPVVMWLGVWEYGGVWRDGGDEGCYVDTECLRGIGDGRMTMLSDALLVYGFNAVVGPVLRLVWYHDKFIEWADEIAHLSVLPNIQQHNSVLCAAWCGLVGCPYPYVIERILVPGKLVLGPQIFKEHSMPMHVYKRMLYPRWGAGL